MKRTLNILAAALVVGVAATGSAAAHDSFAISIGAPGFGVGYATGGYGYAYAAPPVSYYGAPYYPAPVVYGGPFVRYYRGGPYWGYRYWRR